ncbi:hypothetical protein BN2476_500072 [Paraburkholderia piptadeniae]|uniref:Uncharacterized protein n=1 Tax=Paraburkholderia piptadeniae TaxID=1701573 RepID=A0A1N7SFM7_9BURK|nr:hypothetical protein BN2476_500072 [Paraburkholderia piptadeniae]
MPMCRSKKRTLRGPLFFRLLADERRFDPDGTPPHVSLYTWSRSRHGLLPVTLTMPLVIHREVIGFAVQTSYYSNRTVLPVRGAGHRRRLALRAVLEKALPVRGPRSAGVDRLHGPGQLGHRYRSRFALRL